MMMTGLELAPVNQSPDRTGAYFWKAEGHVGVGWRGGAWADSLLVGTQLRSACFTLLLAIHGNMLYLRLRSTSPAFAGMMDKLQFP